MVLLVASATELSAGAADTASSIAVYGFYSLVVGVALQIASHLKYGEAGPNPAEVGPPEANVMHSPTRLPRGIKVAAVAAVALVLIGGVVVGYPALFHPGPASIGSGSNVSSGTASLGCSEPRNDGMLFIGTNATVSIEICGQSYVVQAGVGGGLTYPYHSGPVKFTAPSSVNGSRFEFWYVFLSGGSPERLNSTTITLSLHAGLTPENSLIDLYYTAGPSPTPSTSGKSSSSTSSNSSTSSTSTMSSAITSTSSATITSTSSRSSTGSTLSTSSSGSTTSTSSTSSTISTTTTTAALACSGTDGGLFVSTNIKATVSIEICGNQYSVPGGVGGGLDFSYHAGLLTFVAPTTAGGKTFEFWYVVLPSHHEQVGNNRLTISIPAGYAESNSIIEAFYG